MKADPGKTSPWMMVIIGLFGVAFTAAIVWAQATTNQDKCAVFQHSTVALPTTAATPTAKLIAGVTGKTIYICAIHLSTVATGATPAISNLFSGTGTTCGTGTT